MLRGWTLANQTWHMAVENLVETERWFIRRGLDIDPEQVFADLLLHL